MGDIGILTKSMSSRAENEGTSVPVTRRLMNIDEAASTARRRYNELQGDGLFQALLWPETTEPHVRRKFSHACDKGQNAEEMDMGAGSEWSTREESLLQERHVRMTGRTLSRLYADVACRD